jgi:hypothetical protein
MSDSYWEQPIAWDRQAARTGNRSRVFGATRGPSRLSPGRGNRLHLPGLPGKADQANDPASCDLPEHRSRWAIARSAPSRWLNPNFLLLVCGVHPAESPIRRKICKNRKADPIPVEEIPADSDPTYISSKRGQVHIVPELPHWQNLWASSVSRGHPSLLSRAIPSASTLHNSQDR